MKIVFISGVKLGFEIIKEILEKGWRIDALFSYSPEKKKLYSDYTEFDTIAIQYGIMHKKVDNINDKDNVEIMKTINPDLILVMGWSQLLHSEIINIPRIGVIGSHPSELPKYRGRAPIPWTIIKGLEKSAETFFWIKEGVDDGDILDQEIFLVEERDDAKSLYEKVTNLGKKMIIKNLELIEHGIIIKKKQDPTKFIESWPKRTPENGRINWSTSNIEIDRLIRATTNPYPGAFTFYKDLKLKIWNADLSQKFSSKPGQIMEINDLGVYVATGNNSIILQDISINDDMRMKANVFFSKDDIGYILE